MNVERVGVLGRCMHIESVYMYCEGVVIERVYVLRGISIERYVY